ncbi:hypothetical protein D3C80_1836410 [compost metagenome]
MQHQLAQRAKNEERENPAHQIDQSQCRAGHCQPAAGAEEQAGTDGTADGDHLYLPVAHAFVITGFMGV